MSRKTEKKTAQPGDGEDGLAQPDPRMGQPKGGRDKHNVIPFPVAPDDRVGSRDGQVVRRESLRGLLSFYHREAG